MAMDELSYSKREKAAHRKFNEAVSRAIKEQEEQMLKLEIEAQARDMINSTAVSSAALTPYPTTIPSGNNTTSFDLTTGGNASAYEHTYISPSAGPVVPDYTGTFIRGDTPSAEEVKKLRAAAEAAADKAQKIASHCLKQNRQIDVLSERIDKLESIIADLAAKLSGGDAEVSAPVTIQIPEPEPTGVVRWGAKQ